MLRFEAGAQPFVRGHGLGVVGARGRIRASRAAPSAPECRRAGAPVGLVAGMLGVVVGVMGSGGATSWRSRPPGQAMPTTMAPTSTSPERDRQHDLLVPARAAADTEDPATSRSRPNERPDHERDPGLAVHQPAVARRPAGRAAAARSGGR